jgi:uncharacterized protein YdiU (UPF0061 family)
MHAVNPRFVLRNYIAREAIDLAEQGEPGRVMELLEVLRRSLRRAASARIFRRKRPIGLAIAPAGRCCRDSS